MRTTNPSAIHLVSRRPLGAALLLILLAGCPGDETTEPAPESGASARDQRLAALEAEREAAAAAGSARTVETANERRPGEILLSFESISLEPKEASVAVEEFKARSTLVPGASPFTEVEYEWRVGDRELVGYRRPSLPKSRGLWETGDTISVVAVATDNEGRSARSETASVTVGNTPPTIVTKLENIKYMNGTLLRAEDPDGDEVSWSVEGEPPGVSVSKNGKIVVRTVQLKEEWSGEAVFVATDPYGARSEIHIPFSINAAKDARTEDAGQKTNVVESRQLTEEELAKKAEEDARRFEKMSREEIDAELDRRDELEPQ